MAKNLSSRKLAGVIVAIFAVVVLVLGLAVIQPTVFTEAPEVVLVSIGAIAGLGGFQVWRQGIIDKELAG